MASSNHLAKLKQGVAFWNQWRQDNWNIKPDLSGVDFAREPGVRRSPLWDKKKKRMNMDGINLAGCDLTGSSLRKASIQDANIVEANLTAADLRETDMSKADMRGCHLNETRFVSAICRDAIFVDADVRNADFWQADLTGADLEGASLEQSNFNRANLHGANLSRANLYQADLRGVNLRAANMDHAGVIGVKYDRRSMPGKFQGIRGVDSIYGDAIFRRDALDQDYVDTLAFRWRRSPMRLVLWFWSMIDYGRSIGRILWIALLMVAGFGLSFTLYPDAVSFTSDVDPLYAPYLASLVTFTSLGLAEGAIANDLTGQILLTTESVLGFLMLGVFISVLLANIARRS